MSQHQLHLSYRRLMLIRVALEQALHDTRAARRRLRLPADDRATALMLEREYSEILAFLPMQQ
jgi:hypothetical protein